MIVYIISHSNEIEWTKVMLSLINHKITKHFELGTSNIVICYTRGQNMVPDQMIYHKSGCRLMEYDLKSTTNNFAV